MKYKNYPSLYELKNIIWFGLDYDKEKLIDFINTYNDLIKNDPINSVELISAMDSVINSYHKPSLEKLLNNDEEYSRWALIEKLARTASIEIILDQKYSKETFLKISNLPISDYKLVVSRTKELVKLINDITIEAEADISKIPGVR